MSARELAGRGRRAIKSLLTHLLAPLRAPLVGLTSLFLSSLALAHFEGARGALWSLYAALSPLSFIIWVCALALTSLKLSWRPQARQALALSALFAALMWPPSWLLRAERPLAPPPQLRVSTWNVGRLGELNPREVREQRVAERAECVSHALEEASAQVIALQEISLKRLSQLKERLELSCKHVDYHGRGGRWRGGLATCVTQDSPWEISRARDFSLGGEWRALFVELKAQRSEERFNVLNVHFAPHGVAPRDLKEAVHELSEGSSEALYALMSQLVQTTQRQGEQVEELMRALNTLSDPTLILGDFNAPPHTALHKAFDEASDGGWVDAWREVGVSFGATRYVGGVLPLRIDFIYALRRAFDLGSARVGAEACSDHQPLHLRAQLKGA